MKNCLMFILLVSIIGCAAEDNTSNRNPNIIFIMTDDLGYGDVTCYNPDSKIPTPNIDKLAQDGIMFTDAHSPSSVCTPTRYGVLTGRYCWRTWKKRGVFGGYNPPLIENDRVTVASFLKQNGYRTAAVGKWHVGWTWPTKDGSQPPFNGGYEQMNIDFTNPITNGPNDLGFDYFFGTSGCTTDDPPLCFIENNRSVGIPDRFIEEDPADEGRDLLMVEGWRHEDADFEFKDKSIEFIEDHVKNNPDKPFFVYLPLSVPHIPWFPHEDFKGTSEAGPRGDQVVMADFIVGEIVRKLDELKISDNTLLIFTSDNGPRKGIYGHKSAGDWRGYKGSIWEGGHRVPFIAKWPGKIKPNTTSDEITTLTDLLATSAAIINIPVPDGAAEDSYNILPALLGEKYESPIRDITVHHSGGGVFAIRQGDWKLILGMKEAGYDDSPEEGAPGQLYNLKDDPGEQNDLYEHLPEIVERMTKVLNEYKRGA